MDDREPMGESLRESRGPAAVRKAGLAAALALMMLLMAACGLVGGSGEEEGAATDGEGGEAVNVDPLQLEIDNLFDQLTAERVAKGELDSKIAELEAQLATKQEEVEGKISLERARLVVRRYAGENKDIYGPDYFNIPLVWEVDDSREGDEFYYIYLTFRPGGLYGGTPGREEFITNKAGDIEFRQVLTDPDPDTPPSAIPEPQPEAEPEAETEG